MAGHQHVQGDVIEALRLMECSKLSLHEDGDERQTQDVMSAIYSNIRDMLLRSPTGLTWADIQQCTSRFEVRLQNQRRLLLLSYLES